ncbi:MAG TPA: flagellar hook-basal body complex protein, partial [Micavibrio sp.]
MENSIYIGLSRQRALQEQMDTVANNIANLNTPGYRQNNMVFLEYLYKQRNAEKAGNDSVSMVHDYGQFMNTENGPLRRTENPLDVA